MAPGEAAAAHERQIVGRREPPAAAVVHQEAEVLDVVVLVHSQQVEAGSPVRLFERRVAETKREDAAEVLLVGIEPRYVVVDVLYPAERMQVEPAVV